MEARSRGRRQAKTAEASSRAVRVSWSLDSYSSSSERMRTKVLLAFAQEGGRGGEISKRHYCEPMAAWPPFARQ